MRFATEIVSSVRKAVGDRFLIIFRLSLLDLVEEGSTWEEVVQLAHRLEEAGVSIINTGIGWHEARVPTIATMVPRGAFAWVTEKIRKEVSVPTVTSNRINMPELAESILAEHKADLVSMARPLLADPDWVEKAEKQEARLINTCIGCNQACLDLVFQNKKASCLVNPQACNEDELEIVQAAVPRTIAVVGAGPAGLAFSTIAAQRGHQVTLFEKSAAIGGQFTIAARIPGKGEFLETLRYYTERLTQTGVDVRLGTLATVEDLTEYDHVVVCTGVQPRIPKIPGVESPNVVTYLDVLSGRVEIGPSAAIIGAGGIGFDVADFLTAPQGMGESASIEEYLEEWGIDTEGVARGGLRAPEKVESPRTIYLCQRKTGKLGANLGKTTGWIHRTTLKNRGVVFLPGCTYTGITENGLGIEKDGEHQELAVDHVILCAGQLSENALVAPLREKGRTVHQLGGADLAAELDARRAIDQGTRLAISID